MDILTRLMSDTYWFVSTTAASLDVTVIGVCVLSMSICAGLAAFLFSFFKEQTFEDGLKATRNRLEDKETRRKQQEEKEAAKQRANELKKARKASKRAAASATITEEKENGETFVEKNQEQKFVVGKKSSILKQEKHAQSTKNTSLQHQVKQQLVREDSQAYNEDRATQSIKDAATNKRKKGRKKDLHPQSSEISAKIHEVALSAENGHDNTGYAEDEDVDQEELGNDVEDYREKADESNDVKNLYYNQLNDENQQKTLIEMMNIDDSRGSSTLREDDYEEEEQSSSTATPEPASKKAGKQNQDLEQSATLQEPNAQVDFSRQEKGKNKKAGKMTIEEVDFVPITDAKVMTGGSSVEIITSNPDDKVPTPVQEPLCEKKEASLCYDDASIIQHLELQQASPKKGKKKGGNQQQKSGPSMNGSRGLLTGLSAHDLITTIKSVPLEAAETQTMIDVLLNRQLEFGGAPASQNGWVEPGSQRNKIDQLERELASNNSELEDERSKVKSITERLQNMRKELNEERTSHINARRAVDELQARNNQKAQALEARLQQEVDQRHRDVAHLQGQIQYHIQHTQQLQANLVTAEATAAETQQRLAQQPDPSTVFPELDQLRQLKVQMESENQNMRGQLTRKQNEIASLQTQLSASSSRVGEVEGVKEAVSAELQKAKEDAKSLEDKCNQLEKKSAENDSRRKSESDKTSELDKKMEEVLSSKKTLETKLAESEKGLQSKMAEISRLTEENDRLSEQLASAIERPKADGEEASGAVTNGVQNETSESIGHNNSSDEKRINNQSEDIQAVNNKLTIVIQEKDKLYQEKESIEEELKKEIKQYQDQLSSVNSELKTQKAKNDDTKNIERVRKEAEDAQKSFLGKLFGDVIDANDESLKKTVHSEWLATFGEKVDAWKTELVTKEANANNITDSNEDTKDQLKAQIEHYKGVLGETERMLHQLQSKVETEESRWKGLLDEREAELDRVRDEKDKLAQSNVAMEESLNVVNSAEEMEEKLEELQRKLADEEAERKEMAGSFTQKADQQSVQREELVQQITSLEDELGSEQQGRKNLEEKVAQMSQVISTAQEALQQEQKTSELLRQQLEKSDKIIESPSYPSINGSNGQGEVKNTEERNPNMTSATVTPSTILNTGNKTPQSQSTGSASQVGSVASSLDLSVEGVASSHNQSSSSKDKKSKKKKRCVRNVN